MPVIKNAVRLDALNRDVSLPFNLRLQDFQMAIQDVMGLPHYDEIASRRGIALTAVFANCSSISTPILATLTYSQAARVEPAPRTDRGRCLRPRYAARTILRMNACGFRLGCGARFTFALTRRCGLDNIAKRPIVANPSQRRPSSICEDCLARDLRSALGKGARVPTWGAASR